MIAVLILACMKEFVPIMLLRILVHAKLVSEEIAAKKTSMTVIQIHVKILEHALTKLLTIRVTA